MDCNCFSHSVSVIVETFCAEGSNMCGSFTQNFSLIGQKCEEIQALSPFFVSLIEPTHIKLQ